MRVVHASFHRDLEMRAPEMLLQAWPTLTAVAQAVSAAGVDVQVVQAHHQNDTSPDELVRFTTDVGGEIARLAPDLVHVHGLRFSRATRRITRQRHTRFVAQDHGGGAPARWQRPWIRWGLQRVDGVLFTAAEQARDYQGALPVRVPVFEVLESSTRFSPCAVPAARTATGLFGDPCVLWVGRLDHNKDPLTALRAVALASATLPNLQLWCCFGRSPLLDQVQRFVAADPALRERVHLLSWVEPARLEQYYRAADLFLACSHAESSGYALLEAIACGVSPVISSIPSFRTITRGGAIGELVPCGDYRGFARALLLAYARSTPRSAVRRHFDSYLSFETIGRDLRRIYETVLS